MTGNVVLERYISFCSSNLEIECRWAKTRKFLHGISIIIPTKWMRSLRRISLDDIPRTRIRGTWKNIRHIGLDERPRLQSTSR